MNKVSEFRSPDGVRRCEIWALNEGYRVLLFENAVQVHSVDLTDVLSKAEHIAEDYCLKHANPAMLFG